MTRLGDIRLLIGHSPFLPGLVVALVLGLLLVRPVARWLAIGHLNAWLLLTSVGLVLGTTLTPSPLAVAFGVHGAVGCDLSRIGPAALEVYGRLDDPILNVVLFVPLGVILGALPSSRRRTALLVAGTFLPLAIETTQAFVVVLSERARGETCSTTSPGCGSASGSGWPCEGLRGRRVPGRRPDAP